MKELRELRKQLEEHVTDPAIRGVHLYPPGYSPPNILILKRKTVRAFNSTERVALYYSEKLQRYFSVPFTVGREDDSIDDVVGVSEDTLNESSTIIKPEELFHQPKSSKHHVGDMISYTTASGNQHKRGKVVEVGVNHVVVHRKEPGGGKYGYHYKVPHDAIVKEEVIHEDAISHLQKVKAFKTNTPLYHKDGSQTKVDPTTAHALLTVHGSLHPDNQKKMADALEHSQRKFNRILDFSWKQIHEETA